MLDGFALLITEGHAAATPTLQQAVLAVAGIPVEDVLRWGWMTAGASAAVWDHEGWLASCTRQVQVVRDAGALAALPIHLTYLGMATVWTGDFAGAASLVAEIASVAAMTGTRFPPYTLLRLRGMQGREDEASAAIASAIEQFGGQGMTAVRAYWAAAVLYNGLARYQDAALAARRATVDALNHWIPTWVLPELVEGAARAGDAELARDALERLARTTQPCNSEFALGMEARCRALLSDGVTADGLYREAIERLRRTRLRPEVARAQLLYGEWLRRENRRTEAREQLRTAHEVLAAIGMEAFAERARLELQATGEKVRKRTVDTRDDLTAQERQIARLARDGLTNPEIGARLFLSPRTVEWHLRNVFTKLGIRSRRELTNALAGPDFPLIPV
jgi:ATP/maltotriose-dependent transcriptional regulator MalT